MPASAGRRPTTQRSDVRAHARARRRLGRPAARNQPRLEAGRIDDAAGSADFSFVDATNLAANAGHVDHFFIQLLDADDVNLKLTFGGGAGKPAVENIVLKRVRRAD